MGKRKVTQETVAQWVHLHRQAQSYRNIARRFGVDPRTVKSWIQRAGEEGEREHWEAVARQVDARYLDEHYQMLLRVATAVLDAVESEPIAVHHGLSADSLLNQRIQSALETSPVVLAASSVDRASVLGQPVLPGEMVWRLSYRLLDGLVEHEPQLGKAIEKWKEAWSGFQQLRLELAKAAENLFKLQKVAERPAAALKLAVVQEALETRLLGQESCSFHIEERDEGQADLIRGLPGTMKRIHRGSRQEVMAARDAYQEVLKQVSHEARMSPVEDAYRNVRRCTIEMEELVDRLVLIGRPHGQCSLCFNRSIR